MILLANDVGSALSIKRPAAKVNAVGYFVAIGIDVKSPPALFQATKPDEVHETFPSIHSLDTR